MRNVKKRESKGKGKELKGMQDENVMAALTALSVALTTEPDDYCFISEELNEASSAGKPKRRFPDFG